MFKFLTTLLAFLIAIGTMANANEEFFSENFHTDRVLEGFKAPDTDIAILYSIYVLGINQSLSVANEFSGVKRAALYCAPSNRPMTAEVLHEYVTVEMINARTRGDYDFWAKQPFPFTALATLVKFFPC